MGFRLLGLLMIIQMLTHSGERAKRVSWLPGCHADIPADGQWGRNADNLHLGRSYASWGEPVWERL